MQPLPGDTATLLHPKYQASSCEAPHSNGATPALPASGTERAAAAARAFNQVEAAAAGFSGTLDDSATGESSHMCAHQLLEDMLLTSAYTTPTAQLWDSYHTGARRSDLLQSSGSCPGHLMASNESPRLWDD